MKKKMVLCTRLPEKRMQEIEKYCDITIAGELKHGKGNAPEEQTKEECKGFEVVVLGDEYAGTDTINAWTESGMKFIGVAKGTPVTVDNEAIKAAGLQLSYTPGRNRVAVAEFNIGLMIAAARKLTLSSTGIAGYGAIGREVAVRAKAFGMEILAYDPYLPADRIEADGARAVDLDTMLAESDMISIHLPVVEATKGIVNKEWFSKMKPTAIVINTARAAVIDQKDFVEALQNKTIGGAAVDVYWQEPVPANHPLLSMRNVVCTPHMAGLTTDVDNWSGEMMAQEVLAYLEGNERKYIWKR